MAKELGDVIRYDLASGGTIAGLPAAAGMSVDEMRRMNREMPGGAVLMPGQGLRWWERKNFDLGGVLSVEGVERWLESELEPYGMKTFADVRYGPDDPHPRDAHYKVGISVVVWESRSVGSKMYSLEELKDPRVIHHEFRRAYFSPKFPWRRFEQVFAPDQIGRRISAEMDKRHATIEERRRIQANGSRRILGWLNEDFDSQSIFRWAANSCKQWPAVLPEMLQNPETGEIVFIADGGHINNQPSLFNDGRRYYGVSPEREYPFLNFRLTQGKQLPADKTRRRLGLAMPKGRELWFDRSEVPSYTIHDIPFLTPSQRDELFTIGMRMAEERLPNVFENLDEWFENRLDAISKASGTRNRRHSQLKLVEGMNAETGEWAPRVPLFHGFRMVPAADDLSRLEDKDFGWRS